MSVIDYHILAKITMDEVNTPVTLTVISLIINSYLVLSIKQTKKTKTIWYALIFDCAEAESVNIWEHGK